MTNTCCYKCCKNELHKHGDCDDLKFGCDCRCHQPPEVKDGLEMWQQGGHTMIGKKPVEVKDDWEKEFTYKFEMHERDCPGSWKARVRNQADDCNCSWSEMITFIRALTKGTPPPATKDVEAVPKDLKSKIEGLLKNPLELTGNEALSSLFYNQALDDVLKLLEE